MTMGDLIGYPTAVPLEEQLAAVEREIVMRKRVYPHRVSIHKMSQAKADAELAAMRAVAETLRALIGGASAT